MDISTAYIDMLILSFLETIFRLFLCKGLYFVCSIINVLLSPSKYILINLFCQDIHFDKVFEKRKKKGFTKRIKSMVKK